MDQERRCEKCVADVATAAHAAGVAAERARLVQMAEASIVPPDELNRMRTGAEVHEANGQNEMLRRLLAALRDGPRGGV